MYDRPISLRSALFAALLLAGCAASPSDDDLGDALVDCARRPSHRMCRDAGPAPEGDAAGASDAVVAVDAGGAADAGAPGIDAAAMVSFPPPGAEFWDDFESGLAKWRLEGVPESFVEVAGIRGRGVGLRVGPGASGPNPSSYMASTYLNASRAHGYSGSGTAGLPGVETWYRVKLHFPAGFRASEGSWNWLVEWHNDGLSAAVPGAYSIALGLLKDASGTRFYWRPMGGLNTSPTTVEIIPPDPIRTEHWYDLVFRIVWHNDAAQGRLEFYLDGALVDGRDFPTLYTRADGSIGYCSFGLYNYRYRVGNEFENEVNYDEVAYGPTAASVGL